MELFKKLEQQNARLKALLRECVLYYERYIVSDEMEELVKRIREVLKDE